MQKIGTNGRWEWEWLGGKGYYWELYKKGYYWELYKKGYYWELYKKVIFWHADKKYKSEYIQENEMYNSLGLKMDLQILSRRQDLRLIT